MLILTADWHLDDKTVSEGILTKLGEELENQRITQQSNILIILGDFWNKHLDPEPRVSFRVLDAVTDFFDNLQYEQVYMLKGNHDESFVGLHNLKMLSMDKRVKIIDTPTTIKFQHHTGDIKVHFIPFIKDKEFFTKAVNVAPDDAILLMHQTIRGFNLNSKKVSEDGVEITKSFPLVLSGDLHDFQVRGNIIYIGSPYQTRKGESETKYMIVLRPNAVDYIELPSTISRRFIYVESLEQVEAVGLEGKTVVVTGENINAAKLEELKERGIRVVASSPIVSKEMPTIEVDLSTFSLNILRTAVESSGDPIFKQVGRDMLGGL